jgi:DNA-binding NarL/FixJ family response regulator
MRWHDRSMPTSGGHRSSDRVLSARELEVLALVATGARTRAIARQLGLKEATVKTHLFHVYKKLGVANRVAATRWYLQHHATA